MRGMERSRILMFEWGWKLLIGVLEFVVSMIGDLVMGVDLWFYSSTSTNVFTAKCKVQVRWPPNLVIFVVVLCVDCPKRGIHKGGQASCFVHHR
jgi:uncharacterized membrane protein